MSKDYGAPKFWPDDWPDPKFESFDVCNDCQCSGCNNKDCPYPCHANYPCDAPVTKCKEVE